MQVLRKTFSVIENGQQVMVEWSQQEPFILANLMQYPFGEGKVTPSPIKAVVTFTDGNIVPFRGDRLTGTVTYMLRNLLDLGLRYHKAQRLYDLKIYDNRRLLPDNIDLILHYHAGKTLINYTPFYSNEFDLNNRPKSLKRLTPKQ